MVKAAESTETSFITVCPKVGTKGHNYKAHKISDFFRVIQAGPK